MHLKILFRSRRIPEKSIDPEFAYIDLAPAVNHKVCDDLSNRCRVFETMSRAWGNDKDAPILGMKIDHKSRIRSAGV